MDRGIEMRARMFAAGEVVPVRPPSHGRRSARLPPAGTASIAPSPAAVRSAGSRAIERLGQIDHADLVARAMPWIMSRRGLLVAFILLPVILFNAIPSSFDRRGVSRRPEVEVSGLGFGRAQHEADPDVLDFIDPLDTFIAEERLTSDPQDRVPKPRLEGLFAKAPTPAPALSDRCAIVRTSLLATSPGYTSSAPPCRAADDFPRQARPASPLGGRSSWFHSTSRGPGYMLITRTPALLHACAESLSERYGRRPSRRRKCSGPDYSTGR